MFSRAVLLGGLQSLGHYSYQHICVDCHVQDVVVLFDVTTIPLVYIVNMVYGCFVARHHWFLLYISVAELSSDNLM